MNTSFLPLQLLQIVRYTGSFSLVKETNLGKKNSEFKPTWLQLKIECMAHPVRSGGVGWVHKYNFPSNSGMLGTKNIVVVWRSKVQRRVKSILSQGYFLKREISNHNRNVTSSHTHAHTDILKECTITPQSYVVQDIEILSEYHTTISLCQFVSSFKQLDACSELFEVLSCLK